ncbi:TAT-binding protein-like protein 7, AAA ATPase, partial [Exophiala xenobiotica]
MAKEEEAEVAGEGELEIKASQHELLESDPQAAEEEADPAPPKLLSDLFEHAEAESDGDGDFAAEQAPATQEDAPGEDEAEDGDDDDVVAPRGRLTRGAAKRQAESPGFEPEQSPKRLRGRGLRSGTNQAASRSRRRKAQDESSDFDPEGEQAAQEDMSSTGDVSEASPRKQDEYDSSNNGRRSTRLRSKAVSRQRSEASDPDELAAEVEELKRDEKKKRREREEVVFEPRQRR